VLARRRRGHSARAHARARSPVPLRPYFHVGRRHEPQPRRSRNRRALLNTSRRVKPSAARSRRGRPPKFGRPGPLVAGTLPDEVVRGLKRIHADLAWAIVRLFQARSRGRAAAPRRQDTDSELVTVAGGRSLIVVNRNVFTELPGIHIIPLHDDRAFLALDR